MKKKRTPPWSDLLIVAMFMFSGCRSKLPQERVVECFEDFSGIIIPLTASVLLEVYFKTVSGIQISKTRLV